MTKKLLKRVTVEYWEDISGGESNTPETVRYINKTTKEETWPGSSKSKGGPLETFRSEVL
jgi:hypothetical protein